MLSEPHWKLGMPSAAPGAGHCASGGHVRHGKCDVASPKSETVLSHNWVHGSGVKISSLLGFRVYVSRQRRFKNLGLRLHGLQTEKNSKFLGPSTNPCEAGASVCVLPEPLYRGSKGIVGSSWGIESLNLPMGSLEPQ